VWSVAFNAKSGLTMKPEPAGIYRDAATAMSVLHRDACRELARRF
jgi:hypothetical protein